MRRIAFALVALVFVLGVAACGGEEEVSPEPDTTTGTITTETETAETEPTETETNGEEEPAVEGDPVNGKQVFLGSAGCGSCHTFADAGTSGTIGPNLDESQPDYELAVDRVTNGQGAMPAFEGTLTEQEIADVSAYVSGG
jgi:mono/diheme cytochrome c family protein